MRARIALALLSMMALGMLTQPAMAASEGPLAPERPTRSFARTLTTPYLLARPIRSPASRAEGQRSSGGHRRIETVSGILQGSTGNGARTEGDAVPQAPVSPAGRGPSGARFPFGGVPWMPFVLLAAFLLTAVGLKRLS
jgi:hypothetical protein